MAIYIYKDKRLQAEIENVSGGLTDLLVNLGREDGEKVRVSQALFDPNIDAYVAGNIPSNIDEKFIN